MMLNNEINFIPDRKIKIFNKKLSIIGAILSSITIIVCLFFFYHIPSTRASKLHEQKTTLQKCEENLVDVKNIELRLVEKDKKLQSLNKCIEVIRSEKINANQILTKFSSMLPQDVYITSLSAINGTNFTVSFVVPGTMGVAQLIYLINNSELFEKIDIKSFPINQNQTTLTLNLVLKSTTSK